MLSKFCTLVLVLFRSIHWCLFCSIGKLLHSSYCMLLSDSLIFYNCFVVLGWNLAPGTRTVFIYRLYLYSLKSHLKLLNLISIYRNMLKNPKDLTCPKFHHTSGLLTSLVSNPFLLENNFDLSVMHIFSTSLSTVVWNLHWRFSLNPNSSMTWKEYLKNFVRLYKIL